MAPVDDRPVLATPRLQLRPYEPADAPDVRRLAGDAAVAATTLMIPHPYPEGAAEAWINTHAARWAARQELVLAITLQGDGALVGSIGLMFDRPNDLAEIGYWIGVPYWNNGYATEALRAMIGYAFGTLGLHRIQAHHMVHNAASGRVMEKAGMRREGLRRQSLRKNGVYYDTVFYGVLRQDWA
ncbi:MAG TPA: GNAT family N-acetyltransferase [Lacunisphaera sp.]|nr:GNAT family N-acetyltransferase [Lacunisphaera sp.]